MANTSMDITEPPSDTGDNDMEIALLGLTKGPKGVQLEEFVSSGTVMATPLGYWKENCRYFSQLTKWREIISLFQQRQPRWDDASESSFSLALYRKSSWSRQDPGANASGLLV